MSDTHTKRETTDERRTAIAAAARGLIVEKGLEGLRTRDIAQHVGINVATLHYHVPSKAALVELVAESIRDDFKAQAQSRQRAGRTGLELLRMEFEDFQQLRSDKPELLIVMAELGERARRDPEVAAIMSPMRVFWINQIADILRQGVVDGSFREPLNADAGALLFTGALSEFARTGGRFGDAQALYTELERAFVRPQASQG